MNKLTKRAAAALLSGLLVLGQAGPALAAQDDSNYGPAFSTKVEQTLPWFFRRPEWRWTGLRPSGGGSGQRKVPANRLMAPAQQPESTEAAAGYSRHGRRVLRLPRTRTRHRQQTILPRPMLRQPRQPCSQQRKQTRQASANTPFLQIQVLRPDTT